MKNTSGYIIRLIFYFSVVGGSLLAYMVSSQLAGRMKEISTRYVQVHDAVYNSGGYNMLTVKMKEEMASLEGSVTVNASIMTDVEWDCMLIMVFTSLIAVVLFVIDTLKFLKGSVKENWW